MIIEIANVQINRSRKKLEQSFGHVSDEIQVHIKKY
jgi:hypothetical protein